jgi:hypothetical protein
MHRSATCPVCRASIEVIETKKGNIQVEDLQEEKRGGGGMAGGEMASAGTRGRDAGTLFRPDDGVSADTMMNVEIRYEEF